MQSVKMEIKGMSCQHCVHHVTEALKGVSGVQSVQVSLEDQSAALEVEDPFDPQQAVSAVEEAGYTAAEG